MEVRSLIVEGKDGRRLYAPGKVLLCKKVESSVGGWETEWCVELLSREKLHDEFQCEYVIDERYIGDRYSVKAVYSGGLEIESEPFLQVPLRLELRL